ncbi:MAG: sigma-54-dependent Fis family transcriptional regulator [Myxococcota bacterium]|nr:sigma-54-dependent Fis family transcriptional regulator [Myxococcota bacterium]
MQLDEALHAAEGEQLERRIIELALARTGARHGAILLWDEEAQGLAIGFHIVEDLVVTVPDRIIPLREGRRYNGVAAYAFDTNAPYVCADGPDDPHYQHWYFDLLSIAAVPIPYQDRPIGVLTVSSRRRAAFDEETVAALQEIAASSALFLRRMQLHRATRGKGRPFLIKGLSPEWLEVERKMERVAATNAPVLVTGESGTGKELTAHALHFNSRRSDGPFVTVNCAAIPETLLESVLFGHVKGAFTGATSDKRGEFVKADGGTLFLDELGELPVPLQAKVLRAVEDGEVQPLGSNDAPLSVDVRFVAATNRDLASMMQRGDFRGDLYYRLSVMTLELPPLRRYKHDNLEVMARVFLEQAAEKHGRDVRRIHPDALAVLLAYDYPGNVRELKNALEHAVIMARDGIVRADDLPALMRGPRGRHPVKPYPEPAPDRATLAELRERWLAPLESQYLRDLLARHEGNVRRAAKEAGVNPVTLYRLLDKRGMSRSRS